MRRKNKKMICVMLLFAVCVRMPIYVTATEKNADHEAVIEEGGEENLAEEYVSEEGVEHVGRKDDILDENIDVSDNKEWLLNNEVNAEKDSAIIEVKAVSGSCGIDDNIHWEFDGVDTLTINGSGEMLFFGTSVPVSAPWSGYRAQIKTVHVCGEITSIGYKAFENFSMLTNVTITDSITVIEDCAFFGCSGLEKITLPEGVTTIGSDAFRGCAGLKEILLPDSVTSIGSYAFYGCAGISNIIIPPDVESIESDAFRNCFNLTDVVFSGSDISMGSGVFYDCMNLVHIELPDNMEIVELYTFGGCSSLAEIVLPNSIKTISGGAFDRCSSLENIKFPNGLETIDASFRGCSKLANIELPDSVKTIGDEAFYDCDSLVDVIFPKNVTSIGDRVFEYCDNLQSVKFCGDAPEFGEDTFLLNYSLTAYYPADNETWIEDVRQDYGGGVTWEPYEEYDQTDDDELLAAAISTITLSPKNNAVIGNSKQGYTFTIETTGDLSLMENGEELLNKIEIDMPNSFRYEIYGDGYAEYHIDGKASGKVKYEEIGIAVEAMDKCLKISVPYLIPGNCEIAVYNYFMVNNQIINTVNNQGIKAMPWKFLVEPETDKGFNFLNYRKDKGISTKIISKLFPKAQVQKIRDRHKTNGGLCFGIAFTEAVFAWNLLSNWKLSDFASTAKVNWDLDSNSISCKYEKENIDLDEFIQLGFISQDLPSVKREKNSNAYYSNLGLNYQRIFSSMVEGLEIFKRNKNVGPIIIYFTKKDRTGGHGVLAYDYEEYEDKTVIYIIDSEYPGRIKTLELKKGSEGYTGDWFYDENYKVGAANYISFSRPFNAFASAYMENKKQAYLLEMPDYWSIPDSERMIPFGDICGDAVNDEDIDSDIELFWMLEEAQLPIQINPTMNTKSSTTFSAK